MSIYTAEENHPELRCPNCGSMWFRPKGFARVTLTYNAEDRSWIDDICVDEEAPMYCAAVSCMDCGHDCTAATADAFGPICASPQPVRRSTLSGRAAH